MMIELIGIQLLTGISYGFLLFLLAAGLSLIMGVMRILNLAHGSLYMVGAYVGVTFSRLFPDLFGNFWLTILVSGITGGVIGLALERVCFSRLYKQVDEQMLLTLGFIYIFENVCLWIWGPWLKLTSTPSFLSGSVMIGELSFPIYRFMIIAIGLAIAFGLWFLVERTRVGAIIRAGMDDQEMAGGLGLNYRLVGTVLFFLGTFLAGSAGFLGSVLSGVSFSIGMPIMLLAVIVIVVGGLGSIPGALLGAIIVGVIDSFGRAFFPDLAMFSVYLLMIVILLVKPSGILGRGKV